MYIHPFAAGVLSAIFVELVVFFIWLTISSSKER